MFWSVWPFLLICISVVFALGLYWLWEDSYKVFSSLFSSVLVMAVLRDMTLNLVGQLPDLVWHLLYSSDTIRMVKFF